MTDQEPKHTPAPWQACQAKRGKCECGQIWSIPADAPIAIATIGEWGDGEKGTSKWIAYGEILPDNGHANARLIAASPDLLAALENVTACLESYVPESNSEHRFCKQARAAIAKAKGAK